MRFLWGHGACPLLDARGGPHVGGIGGPTAGGETRCVFYRLPCIFIGFEGAYSLTAVYFHWFEGAFSLAAVYFHWFERTFSLAAVYFHWPGECFHWLDNTAVVFIPSGVFSLAWRVFRR